VVRAPRSIASRASAEVITLRSNLTSVMLRSTSPNKSSSTNCPQLNLQLQKSPNSTKKSSKSKSMITPKISLYVTRSTKVRRMKCRSNCRLVILSPRLRSWEQVVLASIKSGGTNGFSRARSHARYIISTTPSYGFRMERLWMHCLCL